VTPLTLDDALEQLRLAYLSGDSERIEYAEKAVDKLDVPKEPPTLLGAALWYAEHGIPVFALIPGIKFPFKACDPCSDRPDTGPKCPGPHVCGHDQCHGVLDATTDPERLTRWWVAQPNANIGLATGYMFDVVDVDGPDGQMSRVKHWEDIFGQVDADNVGKVLTPRPGGMHIYVPPTGDANSTLIVPGTPSSTGTSCSRPRTTDEEWIVEPLLPARRMIALYSAPKAGKSLLMLEIAVAIARGTEVLGATPDRPRRVLYVDFENDPRGDVRTRLEAMDVGPDQLDNLCYLTFPSLAKFDTRRAPST
jgi:uncharacterized protein YndB with AHSA1/START domain